MKRKFKSAYYVNYYYINKLGMSIYADSIEVGYSKHSEWTGLKYNVSESPAVLLTSNGVAYLFEFETGEELMDYIVDIQISTRINNASQAIEYLKKHSVYFIATI